MKLDLDDFTFAGMEVEPLNRSRMSQNDIDHGVMAKVTIKLTTVITEDYTDVADILRDLGLKA